MQNQVFPVGMSVFKVGIGLGGALNLLCTAALANSTAQESNLDHLPITLIESDLSASERLNTDSSVSKTNSTLKAETAVPSHWGQASLDAYSTPALSLTSVPTVAETGKLTQELLDSDPSAAPTVENGHHPRFSLSTTQEHPLVEETKDHKTETAREPSDQQPVAPLSIAKLAPTLTELSVSHTEVSGSEFNGGEFRNIEPRNDNSDRLRFKHDHRSLSEGLGKEGLENEGLGKEESGDRTSTNTTTPVETLSEAAPLLAETIRESLTEAVPTEASTKQTTSGLPDEELGILRIQRTRSRGTEELGILRILQTAQAPPPPPKQPISFLVGRLGFFNADNAFRSNPRLEESIYQSGLAFYAFPKLSDDTSLYAIAETNLARYENFNNVNYNELEVQVGLRQRLFPTTFAQVGIRNQRLYSPGYRDKLFSVSYIDTLISHRSILNSKTWLDSFYQARLGFADPDTASRFRQTFSLSFNHSINQDLRTSLLYQLDFDDYTQVSRYDTYQQLLGIVSYRITPESRISVFGGTRFGRSSSPGVNLDDTFYGAGLNVSVPLF
ncbi:MAG: hypothetical protein AAF050_11875 [Cyanobacteria bacterium J06649_5]